MASPIGYLIHPPDPPDPSPPHAPPQKPLPGFDASATLGTPIQSADGSRSRGIVTPSAVPSADAAAATSALSTGPAAQQPAGSHSKTPSLYQCAECLRRYSRPEHLQRHIATHTLGKRFVCDICSKAFSRADLLKRHRANHLDSSGTKRRRINASPSASRVAHACQACARARVKCEESKPCTRCRNRGLTCQVASEDPAMRLLHLSAERSGSEQETSPDSVHSLTSSMGYAQSTDTVAAPSNSNLFAQSIRSLEMKEDPMSAGSPSIKVEGQLLTPAASLDQSGVDHFRPYAGSHVGPVAHDNARAPFADFLRDVLYDQPLGTTARLGEPDGFAVLDFCDDANLDFSKFDFGLLDSWNFDAARSIAEQTASSEDNSGLKAMRSALTKVWTESPWRWDPHKTDGFYAEHAHLTLPSDASDAQMNCYRMMAGRVSKETLSTPCRDKIMAVVLSTCRDKNTADRLACSFPSADAMDSWIQIFLAAHSLQVSSWIHYGSFSLNSQSTEWQAIAAAAGAVLTPTPLLRRFGLALQEMIRVTIPNKFDENNSKIAELGDVQALVLIQDVGLWSGNRRKTEIAECHLSVPIAMMRHRGKFGKAFYPDIVIFPSDVGQVLEDKWKKWQELESWKRLVFHSYLRDAQASMTQFTNPFTSYAELTLPLPCSRDLWFARNAEEFKTRYLAAGMGDDQRLPSLCDLLQDVNLLSAVYQRLDLRFCVSIFLHAFWSLIWEYRQLNSVHRPIVHMPSFASNTMHQLLDSRHQELCKQLQAFEHVMRNWQHTQHHHPRIPSLSAQESMVLHLLWMNLHVSLSDLQLFSGKEGEDQAKRVYPALQRWVTTAEARRALWHAGQVLRWGRMCAPGHLKDFYAVAVHHAALCLWTYGIVMRASRVVPGAGAGAGAPVEYRGATVFLDGEESPASEAWLNFGQGVPAIQNLASCSASGGAPPRVAECVLEDPRACMEVAQGILSANFVGVWGGLPSLSENIISVLKQLEDAAWVVART